MRKKILSVFILSFFILTVAGQINEKPFVIPELQEWTGGQGVFTLNKKTAVVVPADNPGLAEIAEIFAEDYFTLTGNKIRIKKGSPKDGDIVILLADTGLGEEGYTISIGKRMTVEAGTPLGAFWATRTMLQLAEQSGDGTIPAGYIKDYPLFAVRGFMLDCGRKYFPIQYLYDCVKIMSYYKMNSFQVHLNDNGFKRFFGNDWMKTYSAFRLESDTYPGLAAKDGHYSKKEFIDLQVFAEKHGVTIIPEIDAPAHSLAFAQYRPEVGSKEYGEDHLDLFKDETYEFMDALWAEYLSGDEPVFRGKAVHIGTDEYSNKKQEVVEQFRHYTDHYIKHVESFGKQAYMWGALTHAKGDTPVKSDNVVMSAWYNGYAEPFEMVKQGYKLISIPDRYLYIVPAAGYYYDYLNIKYLYENWTPPKVAQAEFAEDDPNILGGMFAVWNDHVGNGISVKDVHHRVFPAMQTLAVKMWTGANTSLPYVRFEELRHTMSEAPGVNVNGRIGSVTGKVYSSDKVTPGSIGKYEEVGYPYTVEFDVEGADEEKGTVLFGSSSADFYLSDPEEGKVGFSRDGYLMTFDYKLPADKMVRLKIKGNNKYTELYENDRLVERLDIQEKIYDEKSKTNYVRTLVFPLRHAGNFRSKITGLEVYNY